MIHVGGGGGHHGYIGVGECSVPWRDIMSTLGNVQYIGGLA